MQYRATHRFARIAPRKVRLVADLIRGKTVEEAQIILRYLPHRGARLLEKVLQSALGNAEDRGSRWIDELVVSDARVDEGPRLKRLMPRARGMAHVIRRRMSHIHVAVEEPGE